jgi:8-amino-7-oxononanoate synthase
MDDQHPTLRVDEIADAALTSIREQRRERSLRTVDDSIAPIPRINGHDAQLFCGSNYLDLAHHPEVVEAAARGARDWGCASGGSRLINGNLRCHEHLEEELADYLGTEAALVFGPGYMANVGIVPALAEAGDLILSDALSHASLIDGCQLSKASVRVFPHSDVDALQSLLEQERTRFRRVLLAVDGLYSMDGDVAPLTEFVELAERYDLMLLVDDTHATGTIGEDGRGSASRCGVAPRRIDMQLGSLAKALGSYGSFVAGTRAMRNLLINTCRSFIFSCALPPPQVEAARAALRVMRREPQRRQRLQHNGGYLRDALQAQHIDTGPSSTHVVPVVVGSNQATMNLCENLLQQGFFTQGIRYPSVPDGTARLRLTVASSHQEKEIDSLVGAIARTMQRE